MRIQLRLFHLLGLQAADAPSISHLAKEIGITRHQLMHLLDRSSKQINRHALENVCKYLVQTERVLEAELPGALFVVKPDRFWSMARSCQHVEISMGTRWDARRCDHLVAAADSLLHAAVVNRITTLASDESRRKRARKQRPIPKIDPRLTPTWCAKTKTCDELKKDAIVKIEHFREKSSRNATICLGSVKSNPLSEPVIAFPFVNAVPFRSEDDFTEPVRRSCPCVMIYRKTDDKPLSCWGGRHLSAGDRKAKPGMYFETETGQWEYLPYESNRDAGLVYFRFDKIRRSLEMVIGGFTGRASRCVAAMLQTKDAEQFWPPVIRTDAYELGMYVVAFTFRPARDEEDEPVHNRIKRATVIRLPDSVLQRRLKEDAC